MTKRRVVVTGMGTVTPYGVGVDKFWDNLKEGKSCISNLDLDPNLHTVLIGGQIKNVNVDEYIEPKEQKRLDRYNYWALIAADEAYKDANLENADIDPYRFGVIFGSAAGGFHTIETQHRIMLEKKPTKCSPFTVPMIIVNMGAGKISIKYGAKGLNKSVVTACATSAHSIGDAFRSIQWGDADIIISGGAEAAICDIGIGGFTSARTLSKRNDEPEKASRPYDKDRDGFVMTEGAGVLVLEELEHAKKRGAKIYAEIVGYGQTADAYDIVAPDPEGNGAKKAMENALLDANLKPQDVDYVNAHGTSTGLGDIAESQAIASVFGDLDTNKKLKVNSTKSMTGHALGASGAVESIACIKAIINNIVPPTINLDNQDEKVANLNYVPHKAVEANVDVAITNSFGFGGHNATLVFKRYKD